MCVYLDGVKWMANDDAEHVGDCACEDLFIEKPHGDRLGSLLPPFSSCSH